MWVSLYPWTAKTRRGERIHLLCAGGAVLVYLICLRPFHHHQGGLLFQLLLVALLVALGIFS